MAGFARRPSGLRGGVSHQAGISLVCKNWKAVIRRQARKAAVSDVMSVKSVLQSFPNLIELHLHGIKSALPEEAVHAAAGHTSLRSLHLNSVRYQPALLKALAAAGKLQELHVTDLQPPVQDPLPLAQAQLAGWPGLQKLHLKDTGSQSMLNTLLDSFGVVPHLTELSLVVRTVAEQQAHDPIAERGDLAQLPLMPQLQDLRMDNSGLTRHHHILPQLYLTSLALVNELQLPDGFFNDLRSQTALRGLDLSSWTGPRPATISDANVAAVLPCLRQLTYLSLGGCSALHVSCLASLGTACPMLQHLNIASLQRSGATLPLLDNLTHLDISCDNGDAATYCLPPGLLKINFSNTVLGDPFSQELRMTCPDLYYADARGCKTLTSRHGLHEFVKCRQLEVVLLHGSGVGCTGIAYLMLRRGRVRLAEDLGCDKPWSFEPWANDAVILLKQAEVTLRRNFLIRLAFFLLSFDQMLFGLSALRLVFWWLGAALNGTWHVGRQAKGVVHTYLAVCIPVALRGYGLTSMGLLGLLVLGVAFTPYVTSNPAVRHLAGVQATIGSLISVNVFVGRWLVSPAFARMCSKPTASRIIPFAAAMGCAGWVALTHAWHMAQMSQQAYPHVPFPVVVLVTASLVSLNMLILMWEMAFGALA